MTGVRALRRHGAALMSCMLLLALAWCAPARAQDPRTTVVQGAAREWLVAADRLDAKKTWDTAGTKFKQAITLDGWAEALRAAREPLGNADQRALVSTRFDTQFAGAPPGDYALVQYRTAFAKKSEGHETLTMEREADGAWRVIGYFIR
ncbi:MAG: DUF4019 domain-containing protein [Pseudomonadota bacterium]|nr:DUF4019 domain-containing protein [Pseudomonadota bacterium]